MQYSQTGSGKTYSMGTGLESFSAESFSLDQGILLRNLTFIRIHHHLTSYFKVLYIALQTLFLNEWLKVAASRWERNRSKYMFHSLRFIMKISMIC
jgi:hypothetical protein